MASREGDARTEVAEFEQGVRDARPMVFRRQVSGQEVDPGAVSWYRDAQTKEIKRLAAPRLSADEELRAAEALRGMLDEGVAEYPLLANHLLKNPHQLWLLGEIQMMLSAEPNPVSYDYSSELMEGLTSTTAQREEYEYITSHAPTQQAFWHDVGSQYEQQEREFITGALAQLSARGANRVAALALAWIDSHNLADQEDKDQLFLNIVNWAAGEQDYDKSEAGFFGIIDAPQEFVEALVVPIAGAFAEMVHGAEYAARRKDLTWGQQWAYMLGIKPPENAGDFGWWNFTSGLLDAQQEVALDPFSWLAGFGALSKAVKTIPVAVKATRAGRTAAAARALLPKPLAGSRGIYGGRIARVGYAFRGKTVDELLAASVKNGVAGDAMKLVQDGNISKFARKYPAWKGLSDNAIRTIQEAVQSPEEFLEVLKADALNEVIRSGETLADLTKAHHLSEQAMRVVVAGDSAGLQGDNVIRALLDSPDDIPVGELPEFVYSGTRMIDDAKADELLTGADTWWKGGISRIRTRGEHYASDVRPSGAATVVNPQGRLVLVFRTSTLPQVAQDALRKGDIEEWGTLFRSPEDVVGIKPAAIYDLDKGIESARLADGTEQLAKATFNDLLNNVNIPKDIRLQAAKDRLRLDAFNASGGPTFILSEVPQRSKRLFSWQNVLENVEGTGRMATGTRRFVARATPGRIPNEIHLFSTRQGVDDIRRIGEHFGLRQDRLDELVMQFEGLELGARQDWVWDEFLRAIGRETGVPAFEHQLVQMYKGSGIRNFSASGVDLLDDGSRIPLFASQVADSMPVPVDVLGQVFKRSREIGNRSKLSKAMGFNGRGLGKTKDRRVQLVERLRREIGEAAENLSDEQLHDMAFSMVSPNTGLDGRGIWSGKIMPKAGSWASQLHQWFTKSMLVFRPIQWMWRVALLEEPIRAYMFNLPSLYNNPLQYMSKMREAHYIWNVTEWATTNLAWGQDVMATMLRGSRNDIVKRVTDLGLADDIFGGAIPRNLPEVRRGVEQFIENALYGRVRPNKLDPIKRVPWAVKNRAHSVARAEKAMKKLNLPDGFEFHKAAEEISMGMLHGYLGQAVGATERKLYQWATGLTNDEAFTHGRVWGASLIQLAEDGFGNMALRRKAALLRGLSPDVDGRNVVNSSRWQLIAPDLRMKYLNEPNDIAVAERYLDDMLGAEIEHLFKPFANGMNADEYGELLDHFASSRQISTALGHELIDWDLRGSNYAGGVRQVGDFVSAVRRDATFEIPNNLVSPSFDPRFMAEDDVGYPARMANWVLQTFGEKATQTLNRRPAWIHEYDRWYKSYTKLNIPVEHAQRMATDNANKMVNKVYFNMNEAPYYVARLNKVLPFFGATYEVMSTWSYKMPVAVGGTWQMGVGEFARKFDRLMDGLVNMGLLSREVEDDGSTTIVLNLVPPSSEMASTQEMARFLQGAGFAAVNTLDQAVATILGLEAGLGLRNQGYRLAAGHPLNPGDYGILSFAHADIGLNPVTNVAVTALAARIPGAGGPRREAAQPGESLADLADRLKVTVDDLVRYNREVFIDTDDFGSSDLYYALLAGDVDPTTLIMPELSAFNLPASSLWDAMRDTFMPFGQLDSPHAFAVNFIPGALRWVMAGIALQNQPTDEFWRDSDLGGIFGGILPEVNQAQAASQLNEAFMYLEAHDLINDKGPFTRIMEKEALVVEALNRGDAATANALQAEIRLDTEAFLNNAQKVAAESLILRGLTGNMLPTAPGHVRLEEETIRAYWDTREYADSIRAGEGIGRLRNFRNMDEVDDYKAQLAAWLVDPNGDRARAVFRANNPQLMAYLTPKTFYKDPVPGIDSYAEYQRQIKSGEREPSPLHVTMWRARSAAVQADYYNKFIVNFGNDPIEAAATALNNRQIYGELNDERDIAYQALEMWDEMHGSVYARWREENYGDVETWAQDQINDNLNAIRDNLTILLELDDNFDVEIDLDGLANLNSTIRGAIAEVSEGIRSFNELTERVGQRNAYEESINRYFQEIYIPYAERISALYDKLPEVADSERQSLIYEQIKYVKNEYAASDFFLDGNTNAPFPSPLEYSWQGKSEEEQKIKMQQWITRPMEWMDLDQAMRITENYPGVVGYVPTRREDFDIYRAYTLERIKLDEMFEMNEVTSSQLSKSRKQLEEQLWRNLIEMGRGREVEMMSLTPFEKLELSGLLPERLGIFSEHVRYYKQVLEAADKSAGTIVGRQIVMPLYLMVEEAFHTDPNMRTILQDLGINLRDKTALDTFMPWLFFGHGGEW